jgi:hypothetical protein
MKMPTIAKHLRLSFATAGALAVAVVLGCCPAGDKGPAKSPATEGETAPAKSQPVPATSPQAPAAAQPAAKPASPEKDLAKELEQVEEKPRDLGPPLVDHPNRLTRLDPVQPVWIDMQHRHVVLQGEVCQAGYPLEFFATYSNRSYEAVLAVNVRPWIVHAGLVRVGAEPGHPARFQPSFVPPSGTEVAIEVRWKDAKGKVQSAPAQHWIRNIKTKKELDSNWVFAGSLFVKNDTTGKEDYQADSGELICVLSRPTAMLDLPIRGYGALEARSFEAFAEHLPPPGTPITLLLKPVLPGKSAPATEAKPAGKAAADDSRDAEAESAALAAIQPWLTLIDRGDYSQSWQAAASLLKGNYERRDFIQSLNETRKPLGAVKSRELVSKLYVASLSAPGAPKGPIVTARYKTSFTAKPAATETIMSMLDKDKKWRVWGYYVK